MKGRGKTALTVAAVTAGAVLLSALAAGIGSAAAHTDLLPLLRRVFSGVGGVVLLLAAVRLLTHRAAAKAEGEDTGRPPLPITAGLLTVGITLVLLACLIDYIG